MNDKRGEEEERPKSGKSLELHTPPPLSGYTYMVPLPLSASSQVVASSLAFNCA